MCAAAGDWCFGLRSRRSELHTIKGFAIAIAVVLTLSVGLAYAVKVNWLLDHSQPAYSYDHRSRGNRLYRSAVASWNDADAG